MEPLNVNGLQFYTLLPGERFLFDLAGDNMAKFPVTRLGLRV